LVRLEVGEQGGDALRVVVEQAEGRVAFMAQEPATSARRVVMVNGEAF
jgi:hypothetical protein